MPNQVEYTVAQYDGTIAARAKVNSFNLDHVVDKDITSYYKQISSQALFDTGLLPLNGTGVLAIRSAGVHTQIAFQHAPQISYINWGATEGDPRAKTYMLAQPYRVWIADLINGNLYGARMFYSPYPITSPESQLYHLNLPNTNCKGYRGNGVGWICLYHNEDWTNLSFNVKIQKLIERCSGVEAYNDANMSETDGPNFYRQNNKPEYLWNPKFWQQKSLDEGTDWTLDPDLWIPVCVNGIDDQDRHVHNGQPLTFGMALLGKYNSYYNDDIHPKLVNAFARNDIEIPASKVFDVFKNSHNSASVRPEHYDQLNSSINDKANLINSYGSKNQTSIFDPDSDDQNEDDGNYVTCANCEDTYDSDEYEVYVHNNKTYCESCFNENFVYCENTDDYLPNDSDDLIFIEHESIYIDASHAIVQSCDNCQTAHWQSKSDSVDYITTIYPIINEDGKEDIVCCNCIASYNKENFKSKYPDYITASCPICHTPTFSGISEYDQYFFAVNQVNICCHFGQSIDENMTYTNDLINYDFSQIELDPTYVFCKEHAKLAQYCPSGIWTSSSFVGITPWVSPPVPLESNPDVKLQIRIDNVSIVSYNHDYDGTQPHPFKNDAIYIRAMASIHKHIFPVTSPNYSVYYENGKEYDYNPF